MVYFFRDYVSGDIDSQVSTALKELTANKVLQITEHDKYLIVYRTIPSIAPHKDDLNTSLNRKRPASNTSVIFVNESIEMNHIVSNTREVKARRKKGLLKKSPRH